MLKFLCKAVFLFTIPVFFLNGISSHSCETHVCLTWTIGEHVLNLKCRVNNLHFGVKIRDPSDKLVGECVPSEDTSNCDKYSNNVEIAQNILTNITTCAIYGTTDKSLNGKWKCMHGTNKGDADVEVTVLRTKDGNCRALFWSVVGYLGAITLWLLLQSVWHVQVNIVKGILTKMSGLSCCKLDICKSERSVPVCKGVSCLVLTVLIVIIVWVISDSRNITCENQYYVLCSLAPLFGLVFALLFLNVEGKQRKQSFDTTSQPEVEGQPLAASSGEIIEQTV